MQRRELARYHDVAASTKARGEGIGFAGVGIKLGLLVSRDVVTETRRGVTPVATRWHLASRHRAPWKWIAAPGLTDSTCSKNPCSALRCRLRKSPIVRWSGTLPAASTRNATSSTNRRCILRDENTPTQYA